MISGPEASVSVVSKVLLKAVSSTQKPFLFAMLTPLVLTRKKN